MGTLSRVIGLGLGAWLAAAPAAARELLETPVYFPHTKSYFELVPYRTASGEVDDIYGRSWLDSNNLARQRAFKGARGRLAVVRDEPTRVFLRDTFKSERQTWIGLRYWCKDRRLEWVDGKDQGKNDYQVWAANWDLFNFRQKGWCEGWSPQLQFLGAFFMPVQAGFRWATHGSNKYYPRYFVEYPTGKP